MVRIISFVRLPFVSTLLLLMIASHAASAPIMPTKLSQADQLRAMFIVSLLDNIEWPKRDKDGDSGARSICWVPEAKDPCIGWISYYTHAMPSVKILSVDVASAVASCDMLFISHEQEAQWLPHMEQGTMPSLVTVGASEQFIQKGGMINVVIQRKKLHIETNKSRIGGIKGKVTLPNIIRKE